MCSFAPPPTPEIYTLSLHDALPISPGVAAAGLTGAQGTRRSGPATSMGPRPHRQWDQGPTVPAASGRWAPQAHCANLPLLFRIRGSPEMRAELYELAS